jgi:hypothetical protein
MRRESHVRFCESVGVKLPHATHLVVGFAHEVDARRFWDAMRKRFEEFALSLHPEKTRLIEFGRQAADRRDRRGLGKPETFNFLGFTHICGRSRHGKFLLPRMTADRDDAACTGARRPKASKERNRGTCGEVARQTLRGFRGCECEYNFCDMARTLRMGKNAFRRSCNFKELGVVKKAHITTFALCG